MPAGRMVPLLRVHAKEFPVPWADHRVEAARAWCPAMPFSENAVIGKRPAALLTNHERCCAAGFGNGTLRSLQTIHESIEAPEVPKRQRAGFVCREFRLGSMCPQIHCRFPANRPWLPFQDSVTGCTVAQWLRDTAFALVRLFGICQLSRVLDASQRRRTGRSIRGGKMRYHKPSSFDDASAIAAAATGVTRFLAGGTDVLVQLRSDLVTPDDLIDIKQIAGVKDIFRRGDGSWRIGAAVSGAELAEHEALIAEWPGVVEALELIGSTQIQARCTLVGNLCNGSPAADSVPAMIAAGATVSVAGPEGARELPVEDVPTGPGMTSLGPGEVVSAVNLPPRGEGGGDAYLRFIPRTEMDIAVVGAGVNLSRAGDTITEARVALGAVAPTVLLVEEAGAALVGSTLDDTALTALARAAEAACRPIADKRGTVEFRTQVAGVLARRAAKVAYDRAGA